MDWLPVLIVAALPFLVILACPIGMFFAMRFGMGGAAMGACAHERDLRKLPAGERLALLERQQAELAEEIALARRELLATAREPSTVEAPR